MIFAQGFLRIISPHYKGKTSMQTKDTHRTSLLIILLVSFILRVWGINWGLPYLYNTDEYRVVNFSLKMGATRNLNPGSFVYPTLYLYVMLFVYGLVFLIGKVFGVYKTPIDFGIGFIKDPSLVYIVSRFFSAFFGTLVVLFTYKLGKKIYNEKVGLISAFIVAILPSFVEYSHYAKTDMFLTFLVVVFMYYMYSYWLSEDERFFYISCAILGMAISSKYLPGVCISVVVFVAVFKKLKIRKLITGILLIFCFFILGTPYAIIDYKTFLRDTLFGHVAGYDMKRDIVGNLYLTVNNYIFLGTKTPIVGIWGLLGLISSLVKISPNNVLLIICILSYFIVNVTHYHTQWYFLAGSFPFLIILAANFIEKAASKYRVVIFLFLISMIIPLIESLMINISFTLKDTRTYAKEWIEENIPWGSKVLMDMYAYSPQIKMTKRQLERLYKKAEELNHYKKEYLYYQILSHPDGAYGYEIYQIWRPFYEISTIKHEVEEAQKVRDLVDVSKGVEYVKTLGIKYIILNSYSETEFTKKFYQEVEQKCKLLKEFVPKTKLHPGPIIKIYEVL